MGRFCSVFKGLTRSFSTKKSRTNSVEHDGKVAAEAMAKDAKKNNLILRSSGTVKANHSNNLASVCSKRGEKGVNQDCCIVWEVDHIIKEGENMAARPCSQEFGCQEDMMLCGIFDGHGPWGHFVAKKVCESMPSSLLRNWQELLVEASLDDLDKKLDRFHLWKNCFVKTCADVDQDLQKYHKIDSFYSGTTALTLIRQGELLVIANVGDSRAVLATTSDDGCLVPVLLTLDFKPNLPQEAERIVKCNGQVLCLEDEPGVHRVWLPNKESPGLATSRAFGDFCFKDFGLISVPQVTHRRITSRDRFIVLASDGVWDVISNEEAVEIVTGTLDKAQSAKRLVECAARAWKRNRKLIETDDISAICLFLHNGSNRIHSMANHK